MENRNEVKIGEGTYIVERSFTPGKSVKRFITLGRSCCILGIILSHS